MRWVTASGQLGPDLLTGLLFLDKLRNRVAHSIDANLSSADFKAFVDDCPAYFQARQSGADPLFQFRLALAQLFSAVHNTD